MEIEFNTEFNKIPIQTSRMFIPAFQKMIMFYLFYIQFYLLIYFLFGGEGGG